MNALPSTIGGAFARRWTNRGMEGLTNMRVHDLIIPIDFEISDLQAISKKASLFSSDITFEYVDSGNRKITVDVKSILGLMFLPFRKGTNITIRTKGNDEKEAIDMMCDFIETLN